MKVSFPLTRLRSTGYKSETVFPLAGTMWHRTGADRLRGTSTIPHIYPVPQHVVLTRMRRAGARKENPAR